MPRYIDAEKIPFIKYINGSVNVEKEVIDAMPTADAQEVRHGRWKQAYNNYPRYFCSNCKHLFNNKSFKFCPNCGAKMDGKLLRKEEA